MISIPYLWRWFVIGFVAIAAAVFGFRQLSQSEAQTFPYPYPQSSTEKTIRNLEQEIAFYQQRVNLHPEGGLDLASLANAYLKKARVSGWANWYLLAEQAARRSLANLPVYNSEAQLVLAEIAEARHDFTEAIDLTEGVLDEQPANESALSILVTANLARGNIKDAASAAETLVKQLPTAGSLGLKALVESAKGQYNAAQHTFEKAITLEESSDAYSSAWLRVQLGRLHVKQGHYKLAEVLYRDARGVITDYPLAILSLAEINLLQGDYQAAGRHYTSVLERSENSATVFDHVALQGLAQARKLSGDLLGAEELWAKAETILRNDVNSSAFGHGRELARLLLERGRDEDVPEALSLLRVEASNRRDALTLELLAWALKRAGQLDEAQVITQEALQQNPKQSSLLYRAASTAEALNQAHEADSFKSQVADINPSFTYETWQTLGFTN